MIDLTKLAVSQWQLQQACNKLIEKLTPKDTGSVVELAKYLSTPFEYSDENTYVYNGTTTVRRMSSDGTYAVFKLADVDWYLMFTVSGATYTYSTYYTIKNVPDEVKELYDTVSDYAVVKILNGVSGESWKVGSPNVFIDSTGLPMKYVFVPDKQIFVARKADKTYIYAYALSNGVYTFVESAAAGTDAYSSFDAYIESLGYGTNTLTDASVTIAEPAENVIYNCGTLTSLNISNISTTSQFEVVIFFTASSDGLTLTTSTNQKVVGDLDITKGSSYVMAVFRGSIAVSETSTASASYSAS